MITAVRKAIVYGIAAPLYAISAVALLIALLPAILARLLVMGLAE